MSTEKDREKALRVLADSGPEWKRWAARDWLSVHPESKEERMARDCIKLWERDKHPE